MDEAVLVVSNGGHCCFSTPAVAAGTIAGEAGFANALQLTLQGGRYLCRVAEGQLVTSEQQGMNHCQQPLLWLWHKSRP